MNQYRALGWMTLGAVLLYGMGSAAETGTEMPVPAAMKAVVEPYHKGLALLEEGKHQDALGFFHQALQAGGSAEHPDKAAVLSAVANNAGNALLLMGEAEEAATLYEQAVAHNPKHAVAINNLGVAYLKQGKKEEAVAEFEKAIKTDPALTLPLNNIKDAGEPPAATVEGHGAVHIGLDGQVDFALSGGTPLLAGTSVGVEFPLTGMGGMSGGGLPSPGGQVSKSGGGLPSPGGQVPKSGKGMPGPGGGSMGGEGEYKRHSKYVEWSE